MFKWIDGNLNQLVITLNPNNLTLNQNAANHFRDVRFVTVGIDYDKKELAIHPVTKVEIERNIFTTQQLHKVSLGNTYARISNKALNDHISDVLGEPLNGLKYNADYDEQTKMLIIDLNHPIKKGKN